MIDFLMGAVELCGPQKVVVSVSGIGFDVAVPSSEVFSDGETDTVYIYMHWNQENGPALFGFKTELEKKVFCLIIGCSGIGPKIALAVLAHMNPGTFISVIAQADSKALSCVNGIGLKKAEQIIVQLRDKVARLVASGVELGNDGKQAQSMHEVGQTLESLNYSRQEINQALDHIARAENSNESTALLVRRALVFLAKR